MKFHYCLCSGLTPAPASGPAAPDKFLFSTHWQLSGTAGAGAGVWQCRTKICQKHTGECPASPAPTPASGSAGHNFIRNILATVRRRRRWCPAFNQEHTGDCPATPAVCPAPGRKFCRHTGACLASPAVCPAAPAVCPAPKKENLNPTGVCPAPDNCPATELFFWNILAVVRHRRRRRRRLACRT